MEWYWQVNGIHPVTHHVDLMLVDVVMGRADMLRSMILKGWHSVEGKHRLQLRGALLCLNRNQTNIMQRSIS